MGEINAWIAKDLAHEQDGLSGNLVALVGAEKWTSTGADCLDINDMGETAVAEADDEELEDACSDSDSGSDSDAEAE
jgi:hypothetical protein